MPAVSPETRIRMAEAQRRRYAEDPTLRERIAAALRTTHQLRPDLAAASAARLRGKKVEGRKLEALKAQHDAMRGEKKGPRSEAEKAAIRATMIRWRKENPVTDADRQRSSQQMREKIATGVINNRGRPKSQQTLDQIAATRRATMAKRRQERAAHLDFARGQARAKEAAAAFRARHGMA